MSKKLFNAPDVKLAIVAVSRDCFPESLSVNRRKALVKAYTEKYGADDIYECPICIVESEIHMQQALAEISETMLAQQWGGPVMFCAAAEESQNDLVGGRGDAYCGMLNASYNLKIRGVNAYIPEYPVGNAEGSSCSRRYEEPQDHFFRSPSAELLRMQRSHRAFVQNGR